MLKFGILLQSTFLGPYRQLDDRTAHHARPSQNIQQLLRAQYHLDVTLYYYDSQHAALPKTRRNATSRPATRSPTLNLRETRLKTSLTMRVATIPAARAQHAAIKRGIQT
jgi:hypothetical protein